jgi:hypothetical protein
MTVAAPAPVLPDHPALAPVRPFLDGLGGSFWPTHHDWSRLAAGRRICNAQGMQISFVQPSEPAPSALDFERRILAHGEVETRPQCWHDAFHACAWLAFPRTKARINDLHVADGAHASPNRRSALRNFLTLFDEGGIVVASTRADLLELLRSFRWRALFSDRRQAVREAMDFTIFGHALYERALSMHYGATGKGLLLSVDTDYFSLDLEAKLAFLDARLEALISDPALEPDTRLLQPVPIKGIPGWDAANEDPDYYDDVAQFRPGRHHGRRTRPHQAA